MAAHSPGILYLSENHSKTITIRKIPLEVPAKRREHEDKRHLRQNNQLITIDANKSYTGAIALNRKITQTCKFIKRIVRLNFLLLNFSVFCTNVYKSQKVQLLQ
jgi:hypothetical protein